MLPTQSKKDALTTGIFLCFPLAYERRHPVKFTQEGFQETPQYPWPLEDTPA